MIAIVTTLAPWRPDGEELKWLATAEGMAADVRAAGHEPAFFAAVELDARGMGPFAHLLNRLDAIRDATGAVVEHWTFMLDDQAPEITSVNRTIRVATGRNLAIDWALDRGARWVLFLDSDLEVPADAVSKLLELQRPIVGGDVPAYCLSGPPVPGYPFPVEAHWNTAGFLLVEAAVLHAGVRWRRDNYAVDGTGRTDDPCFADDVEALGFGKTFVRKDVVGRHIDLVPFEARPIDRRPVR